jgi:hypothetical protein
MAAIFVIGSGQNVHFKRNKEIRDKESCDEWIINGWNLYDHVL